MHPVGSCPTCGSALVQCLGWRERPKGGATVDLRCPACRSCARAAYDDTELRELDRLQAERRDGVVQAYERLVGENLATLADTLAAALALDLLTADDFSAPARASRPPAHPR